MATPKFLHCCFTIICISCATPMSASGFSAEMTSQDALRRQISSLIPSNNSDYSTRLSERKESRINQTTNYEARLICDNNGMNIATGAGNLTISRRFRTKCRHLYFKGASSFLQWTTIAAWLFTILTISKQFESLNSLQWIAFLQVVTFFATLLLCIFSEGLLRALVLIFLMALNIQQWVASALSLSMRIFYPLQVVTFFATPLLFIFSDGLLLRMLALLFLMALNIIAATTSIAAIILGTLVKKSGT